ncbi:hypothetical protein AS144_05825 [Francisella endosymbiont of Amblyomma maculatum]|nr:hypothetical protein AS144_05825 [Francisella endosymbiont of Amblyomma maculatum]
MDNYTYIDPLKQKAWFSQMLNDFDSYPGDIINKKIFTNITFLAFRQGIVLNLEWKEIRDDVNMVNI